MTTPAINFDLEKEVAPPAVAQGGEVTAQPVLAVGEPGPESVAPLAGATIIATPKPAPEVPKFDFKFWGRSDNRQLYKLHAKYMRHVSAGSIYQTKASTLHASGISGIGEDGDRDTEARAMLKQAEYFEAQAEDEFNKAYALETEMFTLMGKAIVGVPVDWRMAEAPEKIDFTAAETYDKYLRANKLAQLLPLFGEARDSRD